MTRLTCRLPIRATVLLAGVALLLALGVSAVALGATGSGDGGGQTGDTLTVESLTDQHLNEQTNTTNVTVDLRESGDTCPAGCPAMFDIVVEGAEYGISAFEIQIEFNESKSTTGGSFINGSFEKSTFANITFADDGSRAVFVNALGDDKFAPADEITVGTVTAVGDDPGDLSVEAVNATISEDVDEAPSPVEYIPSFEQGDVTILDAPSALGNQFDEPADLTGDGLFEDVTGDGDVTLTDALVLFNNRLDIDEEYARCYNFDGDDPDGVTLSDVLVLFDERFDRS